MASMQPSATAAWRRWRFRGILLVLVIPVIAAYTLAMAGNARADGSGPSPDPSAAALVASGQAAPAPAQAQASTDQAAEAAAEAAQEARNVVVSIRVDSPGGEGAVSQANTTSSNAGATNDASTAQGQGASGGGGDLASSLESAAQQAANAVASSTQQAQNIVISIRINSPGDNGSIGQTNSSTATANAGNSAATNQGMPATGEDAALPDGLNGPSGDTQGAPASAAQAPLTSPRSGLRTVLARQIEARPSRNAPAVAPPPARAAQGTGESTAARTNERPRPAAGGQATSSERGSASASQYAASELATTAPQPKRTVSSTARPAQVSSHSAAAPAQARKQGGRLGGISRRAGSWLSKLGHPSPVQQDEAQSVTSPVILTLIAVLVALPLLLVSIFAPDRLRALSFRTWIHR